MDVIFTEIFAQWGVFGILLIALGWYAWDNRKNLKNKAEIDSKSLNILTEISANQKALSSDMKVLSNRIIIDNKYENNKDILEAHDNYLLVDTEGKNNPFKRYLLDYDSDFIIIDLNNSKIETCYL
jgi:hypothetical protein